MNPISIKQTIRLKLDRLFHIDRKGEYGLMANNAYLSPDTVLFSKKNLFMEENTSIPGGAMILNPRSKFIMKKGSFSSYNLCVCPGNHAVVKGVWKHDVTDAMKDVQTQGTGKLARFDSQIAQAGKSGTTTSNRDCLWAGYTPYYTCVVWGGYDDNSKQSGKLTSYPKNIWRNAMSRIHEGLETKDFVQPDGICSK